MRVFDHSVFHFLKTAIAPALSRVPPGWAQSRLSSSVDSNWARSPVSQDLAKVVTVARTWCRVGSAPRTAGAVSVAANATAVRTRMIPAWEHCPCHPLPASVRRTGSIPNPDTIPGKPGPVQGFGGHRLRRSHEGRVPQDRRCYGTLERGDNGWRQPFRSEARLVEGERREVSRAEMDGLGVACVGPDKARIVHGPAEEDDRVPQRAAVGRVGVKVVALAGRKLGDRHKRLEREALVMDG